MRKSLSDTADILAKKRRHRLWLKLVSALGCVVVFVTTYALILPAITQEKQPICALEEHIHTDECYAVAEPVIHRQLDCDEDSLGIHAHTARCYAEDGTLVCGYADYVIHWHTAQCYDEDGVLRCTLPEVYPHEHTDSCYAPLEESGHVHDESCYETQSVLVCELDEGEGHTHTPECYGDDGELVCGLDEQPGHVHDESCCELTETLVCTLEETEAEYELVCRRPVVCAHEHTADCYDENGLLCCGLLQTYEHFHSQQCFRETQQQAEPELVCTLEEHEHTDECYAPEEPESSSDPTADVETQQQWEATLRDVRLTHDYRLDVLAIARSQLGYTESAKNYILDENGVPNGYTRYGAWCGDLYGDWCAMFVSFCLHYADITPQQLAYESSCENWVELLSQQENYFPAHPVEPEEEDEPVIEAYIPSAGDLIFFSMESVGTPDHVGLVSGYTAQTEEEPARVQTIEGNNADAVREAEYELSDARILGYARLPEQEFFCGKTGHVHTDDCQDECTLEEHIHTDECFAEQQTEQQQPVELRYDGEDFTVTVRYGADAQLPEGVTLSAREIMPDSIAYRIYCDRSLAGIQADDADTPQTIVFARFLDISLMLDGTEYEPAAPVEVTITWREAVNTDEAAECTAVHFGANGTELLSVQTEQTEDGETSFTHTQDSFSVVGSVVTASYAGNNETDIGAVRLPVDYYVYLDGEWTWVGSTKTGWYGDPDAKDWKDDNRDYITVAQANSILGQYGFEPEEENPARRIAYQIKTGGDTNVKLYSDTSTVEIDGKRVIPLSRQSVHNGYNIYFLPNNTDTISSLAAFDAQTLADNAFYTVKVYDASGLLLTEEIVPTGRGFSYDVPQEQSWLVAYADGTSTVLEATSHIKLETVTNTTTISPYQDGTDARSHSVTFKVCIDGQWQVVGTLPYYYTGTVAGQTRAYITSDMAAQVLGAYGYTAETAPGYQFGYTYNDIYEIYYADGATKTGYCIDIQGNTLADGTLVQLYTANHSGAQRFRLIDAGNDYSFIAPVKSATLSVSAYGATTGTDNTQLKLKASRSAEDKTVLWRVDTGADGRTVFWSALGNVQVIDLSGEDVKDGGTLQTWSSTGKAHYWYLEQQYCCISNNTVSEQLESGGYKIGLTEQSDGDIICYYLPGVTENTYTDAEESALSTTSTGWEVSVRDDLHLVYSDGALSTMRQNVVNGAGVSVKVQNAEGVLWACVGKNGEAVEFTTSQDDGCTIFTIKSVTQPIEIVATQADPSFTVQYYAEIDRYVWSNEKPEGVSSLDVIDTSGKNLPKNSLKENQKLKYLTLENTAVFTNQNAGNATSLMRVKTEKQLTQMYTDGDYNYVNYPGLAYVDKLNGQDNYRLDAVLVLKDGCDAASTNDDDWWWYGVNDAQDNIRFTNLASDEAAPRQDGVKQPETGSYCILVQEGTVLRLHYVTCEQSYTNRANFHDYDVTGGSDSSGRWDTRIKGINSPSNYSGSSNGYTKFTGSTASGAAKNVIAFGNQNHETGLGKSQWGSEGNNINCYNGTGSYNGAGVYKGCTFGLVKGIDEKGNLIWDEWLDVPKLFNEGTATGKHSYNGGTLTFTQTGDVYTLTSANSTVGSVSNLEEFFNPSPHTSKTHDHIFTNNFWPMDAATNKTDPLMGTLSAEHYASNQTLDCNIQVNGYEDEINTIGKEVVANLPCSDDGRAHNWFFGMNFSLSFTLSEDYVGPLEYIFFGDDDMWVFLDNTLICDIGGVHSSVGEYVDLRDYLPNGSSGQHTLSFFYTERGASGSTCWMSFTLPSVTSATTGQDTGSLQITKAVEDTDGIDYSGVEYEFKVSLQTDKNGSGLGDTFETFSYTLTDTNNSVRYYQIKSGQTVKLRAGETLTIQGIPAGTYYEVEEVSRAGYDVTVNNATGYIASGEITAGTIDPAAFVNRPHHELPNSGGSGTFLYTTGAIALMLSAAVLLYIHTRRRKEDTPSS